jgi:NAD(P)-dependent dehydrogenase (short-subunit alcohol dehydrogenase family)
MAGRLRDKVCIITGTGGSIGRAAAKMFCAEGARVVGCDFNGERGQETLDAVVAAGGDMVSLHPGDLTIKSNCERLVELALARHGGIDVLYNNAAMAYFGWMSEITTEDWLKTINEELNIVFLMCRAAWPHLVKRGHASIINVASSNAHQPFAQVPGIAHTAAKGGVLAMTRQLAMEGGPSRLRANTISPGPIKSNQTMPYFENKEFWASMGAKILLGRPGEPEEIAACAVFLASNEASFVTGADFRVDGGQTAW